MILTKQILHIIQNQARKFAKNATLKDLPITELERN